MNIQRILLSEIDQNHIINCRRDLSVDDLIESIRETGLQQPIGVTKKEDNRYGLVYGFRRFNAISQLGWIEVDANICEGDETDLLIINLQENVSRRSLTPIEEAVAIRRIVDLGKDLEEFRKSLGFSKTLITQRLALLDMHDTIQDALQDESITVNQARALNDAPDDIVERLIDNAVEGMTARDLRSEVDRLLLIDVDDLAEDEEEDFQDEEIEEDEEESGKDKAEDDSALEGVLGSAVRQCLLELGTYFIRDEMSFFSYQIAINSCEFEKLGISSLNGLSNGLNTLCEAEKHGRDK